jgi:hypothetical protein
MSRIQSIEIAVTIVAFVIALTTVNTLAAGAGIGIELGASGVTVEDIQQTNDNLAQATDGEGNRVGGIGQQDPGFLGAAIGVTRTINQLWALTTRVHLILGSYGVPTVIGAGVQVMINLTMALGSLQIVARFKF